jgi:hypothetical protein
VLVDDRAVVTKVLIEGDTLVPEAQYPGQPALAVLDGLLSRISSPFTSSRSNAHRIARALRPWRPDQLDRTPVVVAHDSLGAITQRAWRGR